MERDLERMQHLVSLFHRRWGAPVLGELHRSGGAKFVTLVNRLGVCRTALRATLDALIQAGWAMKNPGHGHPLRPEYVLAPGAGKLAAECAALVTVLERMGLLDLGLRKWSVPVLFALAEGPRRFTEIRTAVPGIGDRALSLCLASLVEGGLVLREIVDGFPPGTIYRLAKAGGALLQAMSRTARPAPVAARRMKPTRRPNFQPPA